MSGIRRYPIVAYFVLAFVISWGGILLATVPSGFPGDKEDAGLFVLVFASMAAGPSIAGIVMTAVMEGRTGLRELLARVTRWRVPLRWYAVALLTAPVLLAVIFGLLSLVSPVFTPGILTTADRVGLLLYACVGGLAAGVFEEIGWTGFATPRMLRWTSLLLMSLTLGLIWSVWHMLPDVWGSTAAFGSLLVPRMLLWTVVMMTPYRLLMTWVYTHTRSVLVAMLMHAVFPGGQALLAPVAASPAQHLLWYAIFAAALWALALIVARDRRKALPDAGSGIAEERAA